MQLLVFQFPMLVDRTEKIWNESEDKIEFQHYNELEQRQLTQILYVEEVGEEDVFTHGSEVEDISGDIDAEKEGKHSRHWDYTHGDKIQKPCICDVVALIVLQLDYLFVENVIV